MNKIYLTIVISLLVLMVMTIQSCYTEKITEPQRGKGNNKLMGGNMEEYNELKTALADKSPDEATPAKNLEFNMFPN